MITGLVSQGCVRATTLGALERGYRVILVSDAHSTYSKGAAEIIAKWNSDLRARGAVLQPAQALVFTRPEKARAAPGPGKE